MATLFTLFFLQANSIRFPNNAVNLKLLKVVRDVLSLDPGVTAMTMHNPFLDANQMSLAELRVRIEADHELSVYKRRDIASACRSLAEWFHLPETSIPASAPYIREKLEQVP